MYDTVQQRKIEDSHDDIFYMRRSDGFWIYSHERQEIVYRLLGNSYFDGDKEGLTRLLKQIYSKLKVP